MASQPQHSRGKTQGRADAPPASPSSPRRGPRADGSDVAAAILEAARRVFSEYGYQGATMRAIAKEVDVDAKLIHYYFGTKAELFGAVIQSVFENEGLQERFKMAFAGKEGGLRDYVEHVLAALDDPSIGPAFLSLLRSLGTHEESREILTMFMRNQIFNMVAQNVPAEQVPLDMHAIGAQILGMIYFRYILEIPAVAQASPQQVAASVAPVMEARLAKIASALPASDQQ